MFNESAIKPLSGNCDPMHLIGGPRIFVVDEGDCWEVSMFGAPRGIDSRSQAFVGRNAAQNAEQYGRKQFNMLRDMALAEQARRERNKELSRRQMTDALHSLDRKMRQFRDREDGQ